MVAIGGRVFAYYPMKVRIRSELMGAIPLDPHVIEAWIRNKAGVEQQEELRQMVAKTLVELGHGVSPDQPFEEMVKASEGVAALKSTCGFKRDENGLYMESRYVKANLREAVNILFQYPKFKWGPTGKAPKAYFVERVFVLPERIYLGRSEPDAVRPFVGHVSDRNGSRATLTYHQAAIRPEMTFWIKVTNDAIAEEDFAKIWEQGQELGYGALRSQGFGTFDCLIDWDRAKAEDVPDEIARAVVRHESDADYEGLAA